jgi:hypothetical protein
VKTREVNERACEGDSGRGRERDKAGRQGVGRQGDKAGRERDEGGRCKGDKVSQFSQEGP